VLSASANFASSMMRSSRASDLRDNLNRDARFVGSSLARDLQDAGVSVDSDQRFGSVATRNDTLMTLSVPFLPDLADAYPMVTPADTASVLPAGGTCGPACIDVEYTATAPFQLQAGDIAMLNVNTVRRLLLVTSVTAPASDRRRVTWATRDSLFVYPSGLTGGLRLTRTGVTVQRLAVNAWFRDPSTSTLIRADGFTTDGQFVGTIAARGVQTFSTSLRFLDGVERPLANGFDADTLNDYDRITSVRVRSRIRIERTDRAINGGGVLFRDYAWNVTPRNLIFERNKNR
jgi:hypothetical protein